MLQLSDLTFKLSNQRLLAGSPAVLRLAVAVCRLLILAFKRSLSSSESSSSSELRGEKLLRVVGGVADTADPLIGELRGA